MVPGGLASGQQFSVELLAGHADSSAVELARLRVELEAERHLRRDLQQEALRSRQALEQLQQQRVRAPPPPARRPRPPRRPPGPSAHPRAPPQVADHAYFRDCIKRQRRCVEHLTHQLE